MNPSSPAAGSDPGLSPGRRETLRAVLAMLVPPAADARLPGAADLPQVVRHVESVASGLPAVLDGLDALERGSRARHGTAFAALDHAGRFALLDELAARDPAVLQRLGLEAVTSYYQQDGVLEAIGLEARPPFPAGYQVISGDLTLLGPVMARGRIYRDPS